MAPRKRGATSANRGRHAPQKNTSNDIVPDIYQDMLADAASSPTRFGAEGKTLKRRRIGGQVITQGQVAVRPSDETSSIEGASQPEADDSNQTFVTQQTAYNDSEDSEESDFDWEEVDLRDDHEREKSADRDGATDQELNLVLAGENAKSRRQLPLRRNPILTAERQLRLEVHKMHILCLLVHIHRRSYWCNDPKVQNTLRKLVPKQVVSCLNHDENDIQFQKSRSFIDGLNKAREFFRSKFKITARGMARSSWADSPEALARLELPDDLDLPTQKEDFREAAHKFEGSRDIGAQLFCALLRSVGVDARLVCSLQPLPFDARAKSNTPQRPRPVMIIEDPGNRTATSGEESGTDFTNHLTSKSKIISAKKPRKKSIKESPYPVYWVEAFNSAVQKWVPVDPLVTNTVAKPSKFEPPASDIENSMTYVVAFEDDGSARDVTRRYVKAYNAKTRKGRVEVTKGGERWWQKVMKMYRREFDLDYDQVEDAELAAKEAAEGMPKNVQDFKDHPYYALERHLRRGEVIHPKREVGKVAVGKGAATGAGKMLEPIYRRRDVSTVKSGDSWYRLGREIKEGEQPLKRVPTRRRQDEAFNGEDDTEAEDGAGTGLYAAFQTVLYKAPPVVNGQIPKNVFGNLDIYTSTMVPRGGIHIPHAETTRAARLLGIDFAEAVNGFEFKGRHGSAITRGAVVALEYREAIEEVIRGFQVEKAEAEELRRTLEALRVWKRFLVGLRIRERIEGYAIEGEPDATDEVMERLDQDGEEEAGGFLLNGDGDVAEPTGGVPPMSPLTRYEDEGGGFLAEESENNDQVHAPVMRSSQNRQSSVYEDQFLESANADDTEPAISARVTDGRRIEKEKMPMVVPRATNARSPANAASDFQDDGGFLSKGENEDRSFGFPEPTSTPDLFQGLAPDELKEAKLLHQLHESGANVYHESPAQMEPSAGGETTSEGNHAGVQRENLTIPNVLNGPSAHKTYTHETPKSLECMSEAVQSHEGSEEDRGSLLSQDPSDEDADPEWLA